MDRLFPIGFPAATVLYLVLYVLTWVIHVVFMNYVLAGSGYLAVVSLFTGGVHQRQRSPFALVLRDWMPFMISAAITAGVAPLLFVQILYKHRFYTANLLGSHRWMIILPILIVVFYLSYVLKSRRIGTWPVLLRLAVGLVTFLGFLFIAYSWTGNYLLSVQGIEHWNDVYTSSQAVYAGLDLLPRFALWLISALPIMVLFVSWQLRYRQSYGDTDAMRDARRCSRLALAGLAATFLAVAWFVLSASDLVRGTFFGSMAWAYTLLLIVGWAVQIFAWAGQLRQQQFARGWLTLATLGGTLYLVGVGVVREAIRIRTVDFPTLYDEHAEALKVGGFPVFLAFFVITGALCAWCFVLVRKHQLPATSTE